MAKFLILPTREVLEHTIHDSLERVLPGFRIPAGMWERIVRDVTAANETNEANPLFVLHREDLSDDSVAESLIDGFGAVAGDSVIEIDTPRAQGPGRSRSWSIQTVSTSAAAR